MDTDQLLLEKFIQNHSVEVLHIIEKLDTNEMVDLIKSLPLQLSTQLFNQMDRYKASRCLKNLEQDMAGEIIGSLAPSNAASILRQVDNSMCSSILEKLPNEQSKSIAKILKYPENTIGAYLDPLVFTLSEDLNVEQGLDRIRENHPHIISPVYILSRDQLLVGFIEVKDLITAELTRPIRAVMNTNPPKILADINIKALFTNKGLDESYFYVPVVDIKGIFLGVIGREVIKNINLREESLDHHAQEASMALGDLFQIGLTSLFRSTADIIWDHNQKKHDIGKN